jgi:hypothetical protein
MSIITENNNNDYFVNFPINSQRNNESNHIYSYQGIRYICCYFKLARTSHYKIYNIPIDWKICDLINNIRGQCNADFPINILTTNLEFVLVGQDISTGTQSEDAPALNENDTDTIYDKYVSRNVFPCFYVRNQSPNRIEDDDLRRQQEQDHVPQEPEYVLTCVICLEQVDRLRLACSHEICRPCFNRCISYGHHRCPICRRSTVYTDLIH